MKKIVVWNHAAEYNLGGPSIMHGIYELLKEVYPDGFELVNLQQRTPLPTHDIADMPYRTIPIQETRAVDFLKVYYLNQKIPAQPGKISLSDAFEIVKGADVVVDLFAIDFCDKFGQETRPSPLAPLYTKMNYPLAAAARKYHVRSGKVAASFGPMTCEFTRHAARFAADHLYDFMIAREHKSQQAMRDAGSRKDIPFSPDIANLMPFTKREEYTHPTVGLSISHQIIRQWKSAEDYIFCMAKLCLHIQNELHAETLLIPNEILPQTPYNDIDVAEDIAELLGQFGGSTRILNSQDLTSTEIKNHIAGCELLVASRYHSCVAALSSCTPLLVVGWHYKYEELMHSYRQDAWLLSEADCDSQKLLTTFDALWEQRAAVRQTLTEVYPQVRAEIIAVGRRMLGEENK